MFIVDKNLCKNEHNVHIVLVQGRGVNQEVSDNFTKNYYFFTEILARRLTKVP